MKKIKVEDAIGMPLAHDITEIRPGEFKGVAYRKGHKVEHDDVCHLMRLGKRHLYVRKDNDDKVHEDDAVRELAQALSGPGVVYDDTPSEGKLQLCAEHDGLLTVNVNALVSFNMIQDVMCASLHTHTPVKKGQKIAGTRAVPLMIDRQILDLAVNMARENAPILSIKKFLPKKARLIITGSEIYNGLIKDRFKDIVERKLAKYGSVLEETAILPDDTVAISEKLRSYLEKDTDLIISTGGMSVDPDDVTRQGIRDMGIHREYYGAGVLPGTMFLLAYRGDLPVMGIPACALYHEITVFDLILPRVLAGEQPDNRDLAMLAHGGLCMDCTPCRYPRCSFGKTS
jgi:hypothetical protein